MVISDILNTTEVSVFVLDICYRAIHYANLRLGIFVYSTQAGLDIFSISIYILL